MSCVKVVRCGVEWQRIVQETGDGDVKAGGVAASNRAADGPIQHHEQQPPHGCTSHTPCHDSQWSSLVFHTCNAAGQQSHGRSFDRRIVCSHSSPPGGSSTPTTERLRRIEAKVQQMEHNLGANHPQVCSPY